MPLRPRGQGGYQACLTGYSDRRRICTVEPAAKAVTRTQGRTIAGAEAAGGAIAHQWQRAGHPGSCEKAKGERKHPQRGRETLPGYIYESEKYLQKAGAVVLEISAGEDKWWSICAAS